MKSIEYGSEDGKPVVYFHGTPGAIQECAVFESYAKNHNLKLICFDRFAIDKSLDRESYYQLLASHIKAKTGGEPLAIIGFSIGAHVALEVGALLGNQVRHIHLVSAAAPISAGEFIENMAGGFVFKLAVDKPAVFWLLTQVQKTMALFAPRILFRMLFSSATGKDKELSSQSEFQGHITPLLKGCFLNRSNGYMRDINYYVTWPVRVKESPGSVHIWHGTEDNWSPFSMALYLCSAISGATHVEAMEGLSHYSCLYEAVPKICAQLGSL